MFAKKIKHGNQKEINIKATWQRKQYNKIRVCLDCQWRIFCLWNGLQAGKSK
jgi:hypothetical protein